MKHARPKKFGKVRRRVRPKLSDILAATECDEFIRDDTHMGGGVPATFDEAMGYY
jgi:hypothetical protein